MADLSQRVIAEDRRLDKASERTTEELAELRWHWTLDESNPKRISIRAYARAVGKGQTIINQYANGYADWLVAPGTRSIGESLSRARVGAEKAETIEAVAKATGRSFEATRRSGAEDVRTVRAMAEQRAERFGSTVAEEIPGAAEALVKGRKAEQRERNDRKKAHTLRYLEVEGDVASALRKLRHALDVAQEVEFSDEERELLEHSIATLRALLNLIDVLVTGTTKVDWDRELRKLEAS